jgi:hypothetical protein
LRIGRRLWKNSCLGLYDEPTRDDDAGLLHVVAQQLQIGANVVSDREERNMIALILWQAGKKAMQSASFAKASLHFVSAISMLSDKPWSADR